MEAVCTVADQRNIAVCTVYQCKATDIAMYRYRPSQYIATYVAVNRITLIYFCTCTDHPNMAVYRCREPQCPLNVSVHVLL